MGAARNFSERNQSAVQIADLIFVWLADVENEQVIAAIETRFELARSNFRHLHIRHRSFFAANAAEFVIVDQFCNGRILSANRAIGIFSQLQFAELHSQRIEKQQAAGKTIPAANDELDGFHCLNRANDTWQNTEHTAFRAGWNQSGRGRFGIETAVARAIGRAKNRDLALETEDRAIDVLLTEQNARVIHKVARGEIISAVHDEVVVFEEFKRVAAFEFGFIGFNFDVGVETRKTILCRKRFWSAHILCAESDLALQVCGIDDVKIDKAKFADASCRQI